MASRIKITRRRGVIRSQRWGGSLIAANGREVVGAREGYTNRLDAEDELFDVAIGAYAAAAARFRLGPVLPVSVHKTLIAHQDATLQLRQAIAEAAK